ncbi:wax synthase family protein [Pleurotus pulmonarius]
MFSSVLSPSALLIPHGLTIIAVAIAPPAYRKLVFAQILAFVAYNIHTATTVSPSTDWPLAFSLTALVFAASDFLLLTKSYALLHKKDQVGNIEEQPPWARIKWAMALLTSQRMIGWSVEPTNVLPPPPQAAKYSRLYFIGEQTIELMLELLIVNILGIGFAMTPALSPEGPSLTSCTWLWRSVHVANIVALTRYAISAGHRALSLLLIAFGLEEPAEFRPLCGRWRDAYTLRRFWGRTWHQVLRRTLTSHSRFVALEVLKLKPGTQISTYTQLYIAFILSGFIHFWADFIPLGRWNPGTMRFFVLQAIGIQCEDIVIALATKLGLRPSMLSKLLGYILVWQWFAWCLPIWLDTLIKSRVIGAGPQIPIIQAVVSLTRQ